MNKYLDLLPGYEKDKPNLKAFLEVLQKETQGAKDLLVDIRNQFNYEQATGKQLDIIGEWLGLSRKLKYPLQGGVYELTDKDFKDMLDLRMLINKSSLTNKEIIDILATKYTSFLIDDSQDMTYVTIILQSPLNEALEQLLITGNINVAPMATGVNYIIEEHPVFGWNEETPLVRGWNEGFWRE